MSVRILDEDDVRRLLPMGECIDVMAEALASLARGEVHNPLRFVVRPPDAPSLLGLMPAYRGFAADGRLHMLGLTGDTAVAEVPQVRTFAELGYIEPILRMRPWGAVLAPAGTPRHIVELLNTAVIAALDAPEVRDMLDSSGFQRIANSPAAAHAALEDDLANVLPLIRDLGIEAQ